MQVANKDEVSITLVRLKHLYIQSLGPAATVIIGMLTTQLDKIMGAVILTPEEYGRYALASMLAQGCITVNQPIIQAISPKILKHKKASSLRSMASRNLFKYLISVNLLLLLMYRFCGRDVIEFWIKSPAVAENVRLYLNVLIFGAVLNSLYHVNYFNLLSEGKFKQIFWINIIGLVASVAVTPILVREFGVYWVGFAFVLPNIIAILITTFSADCNK
jgi:O-antigen/teichoic acid export membrane protein